MQRIATPCMHTQSFQGERENNVLQLQSTAAAVPICWLYTGAAIMTMNSSIKGAIYRGNNMSL